MANILWQEYTRLIRTQEKERSKGRDLIEQEKQTIRRIRHILNKRYQLYV